jgi:hypothetical protein
LPPTTKESIFEVRPIYRVTQKQLMESANKKANLYARIEEVLKVTAIESPPLHCQEIRSGESEAR